MASRSGATEVSFPAKGRALCANYASIERIYIYIVYMSWLIWEVVKYWLRGVHRGNRVMCNGGLYLIDVLTGFYV